MVLTPLGLNIPAQTDAFDTATDFADLAASFEGRVVVPVANVTARATLATAVAPSLSEPLYVHRADAPAGLELEVSTDGTTWRSVFSGDGVVLPLTYSAPYGPMAWQPLTLTKYGKRLIMRGAMTNTALLNPYGAYSFITFATIDATLRPPAGQTWVFNGTYVIAGVGFFVSQMTIQPSGVCQWQPSVAQGTALGAGSWTALYNGEASVAA
jgi:hypothetical protein